MDTFHWDEHFTTGLQTVDQQHRRLVELINRLGDSFADSSTSDDALKGTSKNSLCF
jgi:hemerythrin